MFPKVVMPANWGVAAELGVAPKLAPPPKPTFCSSVMDPPIIMLPVTVTSLYTLGFSSAGDVACDHECARGGAVGGCRGADCETASCHNGAAHGRLRFTPAPPATVSAPVVLDAESAVLVSAVVVNLAAASLVPPMAPGEAIIVGITDGVRTDAASVCAITAAPLATTLPEIESALMVVKTPWLADAVPMGPGLASTAGDSTA